MDVKADSEEVKVPFSVRVRAAVKVHVTRKVANYATGWTLCDQLSVVGSGCILAGRRIGTAAHVVKSARLVEVQKHGDAEKMPARVLFISHQTDLAVLELIDGGDAAKIESFWRDRVVLPFVDLPPQQTRLSVLGFPTADRNLCVTEGVMSRCTMQEYLEGRTNLLALQIDATINHGNSGGPACSGQGICGIVFQINEGFGFVIPASIIQLVIDDFDKNKKITGLCLLNHLKIEDCENPGLRRFLKLDPPPPPTPNPPQTASPTAPAPSLAPDSTAAKDDKIKCDSVCVQAPADAGPKVQGQPPASDAKSATADPSSASADSAAAAAAAKPAEGDAGGCSIKSLCTLQAPDNFSVTTVQTVQGKCESVQGKGESLHGAYISYVGPLSLAYGVLRAGDVLLSIDGCLVGDDCTVELRRGAANSERVLFTHVVASKAPGTDCPLTVLRDGRKLDLVLPCKSSHESLITTCEALASPPRYIVWGGFVFTKCSTPFLNHTFGVPWDHMPVKLWELFDTPRPTVDTEAVILSQVLPHATTAGYTSTFRNRVVLTANGLPLKNLDQLARTIATLTQKIGQDSKTGDGQSQGDDFLILGIDSKDLAVIDLRAARQTHTAILTDNKIPAAASADLLPLLPLLPVLPTP